MHQLSRIFSPSFFILFVIWFIATAFNLDKAFHIDDTVHLEIARWIAGHPLTPMSGLINWHDNAGPMHNVNQPHLYFYLLAAWGQIFGYSEIAMHALQSLFTLVALYYFYRITQIIAPQYSLLLSTFLVLGPAFLVGQNLMVDIPILSCWIVFYYLLLKPERTSEHWRYFLASLIASAAILMKYSSLPLIPILIIHILIRKKYQCLYTVLVPFAALLGWSYFNFLEYGSVHILDRPIESSSLYHYLRMSFSWIITLGAISPFSIFFIPDSVWSLKERLTCRWRITFACSLLVIIVVFFCQFFFGLDVIFRVLNGIIFVLFIINGLFLVFLLFDATRKLFQKLFLITMSKSTYLSSLREISRSHANDVVLIYWTVSAAAFIVLFSPFMATRHVLLSIPGLLLILGSSIKSQQVKKTKLYVSLATTIILTTNLALSDWQFANFYRKQAVEIVANLPADRDIWFTGHWGWQWYAKQSGMKQLELFRPKAEPGDYVIYPERIHQQKLNPKLILNRVNVIQSPPIKLTYLSTANGAQFYFSKHMPWRFSEKPLGNILVFRVRENRSLSN